jgi:ParB-like chromosome segregation protein Spo0J
MAGGIKELSREFGKKDIYRISPSVLKVMDNWNVRKPGPSKDDHVRYLADSIKEVGIKIPLTIRMENDIPYVVDGECRLLGTLLAISEGADIVSIPVMMEDRYANNEDRVMTMLTCNGGKPLTVPEKAEAFKRLLAYGWDEKKIALKSGVGIQTVRNTLNFSSLDPELQQMVSSGQVSATLVNQVVASEGQEQAKDKLRDAVEQSTANGKKKATRKDIVTQAIKKTTTTTSTTGTTKINWNSFGPRLQIALRMICDAPIHDKGKVQNAIAEASGLLDEMDEIIGE